MMHESNFRYPGIYSFSENQNAVFFGRKEEINKLITKIEVEPITLLYAKSGIGKTSLLNAGVFPQLPEDKYRPLLIRFYASSAGQKSPLEALLGMLKKEFSDVDDQTHELFDGLDSGKQSLWLFLKKIQFASTSNKTLVLVFDQFEELFGYPPDQVRAFRNELYLATKVSVPSEVMNQVLALRKTNPGLVNGDTLRLLKQEMPIKLVFSIRTDRLSFLDQMVDRFKNIRANFLELKPLSEASVNASIVEPSRVIGENENPPVKYESPPFQFEEGAINKIISFLEDDGKKTVETTQLQIICQQIEKNEVIAKGKTLITENDLPDFKDIFLDFYQDAINKLEGDQKVLAEELIENQLIRNEQRISLDEEACIDPNSDNPLLKSSLDILVDARLLRREPNNFDRDSYELAHDTLIPPILQIAAIKQIRADEITAEEKRKKAFEEEKRVYETERDKETIHQQRILAGVAITLLIVAIVAFFYVKDKWSEAEKAQQTAEEAKVEAEKKLKDAENLKLEAQQERNLSVEKARLAEKAEKEARKDLELTNKEALEAKEAAVIERNKAQVATRKADEERNRAEILRKYTEQQRLEAYKNADRVRLELAEQSRLNRLSYSKEIAINSGYEVDKRIRALMAYHAGRIYQENSESVKEAEYDPTIYRALLLAEQGIENSNPVISKTEYIRSISFDPSGKNLYVGTGTGDIELINGNGNIQNINLNSDLLKDKPIVTSALTSDAQYLMYGTRNATVVKSLYKQDDNEKIVERSNVGQIIPHVKPNTLILTDKNLVISVDTKTGEETEIRKFNHMVISISLFSPTQRVFDNNEDMFLLLAALSNGKAYLIPSGHDLEKSEIEVPDGMEVTSVSIAQSQGFIALGFKNGSFQIQDPDGSIAYQARPHQSRVNKIAFSPDGRFLVSTSWDKSLAITAWQSSNSVPLPFVQYVNKAGCFDFSPDGKTLVIANDSEIRSIPLDMETLMNKICEEFYEDLSEEEWEKYIGGKVEQQPACN